MILTNQDRAIQTPHFYKVDLTRNLVGWGRNFIKKQPPVGRGEAHFPSLPEAASRGLQTLPKESLSFFAPVPFGLFFQVFYIIWE